MFKKSSIIAAIAILAGLAGTIAAEARGRHHGGHQSHHRHVFLYSAPVYVAPSYSDCSYAYIRWQRSGSYAWKQRYLACKGW